MGTPHEGWDATSPGDVRGNAGLVSGEVEEVAGALSSTLRCTDRAGTTGRGQATTRGPGIGSRGENRARTREGWWEGGELVGCWWTVGAGLLPKYFSVGANCGIHALSYSRFVIIQGRWQEESGKHMQILALVKIWPFLVS